MNPTVLVLSVVRPSSEGGRTVHTQRIPIHSVEVEEFQVRADGRLFPPGWLPGVGPVLPPYDIKIHFE